MIWERILETYHRHRDQLGLAACTTRLSVYWLASFQDFCRSQGVEKPEQVAPSHVEGFHQQLLWVPNARGRLYSPNTVDQALRMVRTFLRWARGQGHLALDPSRQLVLPRPPQPRPRLLSRLEIERLLQTPDPKTPAGLRDRALLHLYYLAQLGARACHGLDLEALDLKKAASLQLPDRQLELDGVLLSVLDHYLHLGRPELRPRSSALFLNKGGERLGVTRQGQIVREHGRAAGLGGGINPGVLRRSFLVHLAPERRFSP